MWTHWFLMFSMIYNSLLFLIILMLNLSQVGQWELPCQFSHAPISVVVIILSTSLLSGKLRCSRLLTLLCFGLGIRHFSQKPWFLLGGNQYLSTRCVFKPSQQTEPRNRWSKFKSGTSKWPSSHCSLPFHILYLYLSFPQWELWLSKASVRLLNPTTHIK